MDTVQQNLANWNSSRMASIPVAGLDDLARRYDAINIKLDKTGGLTEALALADAARALDLQIMVGCMLATSLAMAPGLAYENSTIAPPAAELWG